MKRMYQPGKNSLESKSYFRTVIGDLKTCWNDVKLLYSSCIRWQLKQWLVVLSVIIGLAAALVLDQTLRTEAAALHGRIQDMIFIFGHWYGQGTATLYLFLLCYVVGLILHRDRFRSTGVLIGESYLFSGIIVTALKSILGRWRPSTNHGSFAFLPFTAGPNDHLSFPSGHVAVAFALSSIMAGLHHKKFWKIFWYALATLTALSRIYHDEHWLSDVFFSTVIGIGVGKWLIDNAYTSHKEHSNAE